MSTSFTFRAKPHLSQAIRASAEASSLPVSVLIRRTIALGLDRQSIGNELGESRAMPSALQEETNQATGDALYALAADQTVLRALLTTLLVGMATGAPLTLEYVEDQVLAFVAADTAAGLDVDRLRAAIDQRAADYFRSVRATAAAGDLAATSLAERSVN